MSPWYHVMVIVMVTGVLSAWAFDRVFDGALMRKKGRLCWWHFRIGSPLFVGTVLGAILPPLLWDVSASHGPMERVWDTVYPVLAAIIGAFMGLLVDTVVRTTRTTDRRRFQFSLQEMLMWFRVCGDAPGRMTTCIRG